MSMSLPFPLSIYASTKVTACEMRFNVCYNVGRCVNYTQNGECKQYHRVCVCAFAQVFSSHFFVVVSFVQCKRKCIDRAHQVTQYMDIFYWIKYEIMQSWKSPSHTHTWMYSSVSFFLSFFLSFGLCMPVYMFMMWCDMQKTTTNNNNGDWNDSMYSVHLHNTHSLV